MSSFIDESDDEEIIKVEKSSGKQKKVSIKNIEPVRGIQVIRNSSPSISSEDSDSSFESRRPPKKTKKIIRRKEKSYNNLITLYEKYSLINV